MRKGSLKAQASVLTTVLIILLALAAVVILWNVVRPLVQNSTSQIEQDIYRVKLDFERVILKSASEEAEIGIKRNFGEGKR